MLVLANEMNSNFVSAASVVPCIEAVHVLTATRLHWIDHLVVVAGRRHGCQHVVVIGIRCRTI